MKERGRTTAIKKEAPGDQVRAVSRLPGREPTDHDEAPAPAC